MPALDVAVRIFARVSRLRISIILFIWPDVAHVIEALGHYAIMNQEDQQ